MMQLALADMLAEIEKFDAELCVSDDTREVLEWLRRPPLPWVAKMVYRLLYQAAYLTLPERYQAMIGMRVLPRAVVVPLTVMFLKFLRFAVGPENPIQDAAIARLARG
jgi:hypothetical protein